MIRAGRGKYGLTASVQNYMGHLKRPVVMSMDDVLMAALAETPAVGS